MGDYHLDVTRFTNPRDSLKAVWRFKQENEPVHMTDDERMFYDWIGYSRYSQRLRVDGWYGVNPVTGEMTLRPPKRYRCKTRKRFVKLLMADGKTRNFAEWEADIPLRVTGIRERYQSEYLLHRAFWIPAIRPKKKKKG